MHCYLRSRVVYTGSLPWRAEGQISLPTIRWRLLWFGVWVAMDSVHVVTLQLRRSAIHSIGRVSWLCHCSNVQV